VSDKQVTKKDVSLAGMQVGARSQGNITFGVLSLIDPETNKVMNGKHATIKALQSKLNVGDEMPGFKLSDSFVNDINTGEATTLRWVEPA